MLVAIYHMIRDDADFLPVDHEEAVTRNTLTNKGLNLTNIIAFLGEHGADAETLRLIKAQCSEGCEKDADEAGMTESFEKEKQPVSDTVHQNASEHGPSRKKNPSKSCQTEQNGSFGVPVPTAATA